MTAEPAVCRSEAVGLIAGIGELPLAIARAIRGMGMRVAVVGFKGLADPRLENEADTFAWVELGKLGSLIKHLKKMAVQRAVMVGKVPKTLVYPLKVMPDVRAIKLFFSLPDRKDDTILLALTEEFRKDGIEIVETTAFTSSLMARSEVLTRTVPSEEQWEDIRFGLAVAREIGRLDIGQTVVVKDKAVMAVEAIEGTDEAIRRGGTLAGGGAVVVKVAKPQQDFRFDVPVVGRDTLRVMEEVKASVLAVEAGRVIVMEQETLVLEANAKGIVVAGCDD